MDFSSLMSAQIAKASSPPVSKSKAADPPPSKYLKRSEIEAAREEAYRAEQAARDSIRQARTEQKRKREEEEVEHAREREAKRQRLAEESRQRQKEADEREERERRQRLGLPELPPSDQKDATNGKEGTPQNDAQEDLSEEEVLSRLREMKEPARLFGEDHSQRLKRLRRIQARLTAQSKVADPNQPIPTSLEPVPPSDISITTKLPPPSDTANRLLLARRLTTWFNMVLLQWGVALNQRPDSVKQTFSGEAAAKSQVQALAHLKPLFRKLENLSTDPSVLPEDLLQPMIDIVRAAQERRYVDANDGYLKLSIGNAAWPIGVTMVGIHERSAREKLHESDKGKAHIMADESTRKILQSIKRCLSFAQTKWPPDDLGQMMG